MNGTTTVAAKITLDTTDQTDLTNGGTVQVTINDNGTTQSLNLHLNGTSLVDASGNTYGYSGGVITLNEAAPGNGNTITVTSTVTDVYSNVSASGSAHATQETALPDAPVVTIPLANASGIINAASLNGATSVAAKITLDSTDQTDLTNGGTVQVTINDNGTTQSLNLHLNGASLVDASGNTYGYSGGVITLNEAAPGNGNAITVTSTVTDVYSNVSASGSAHATQETALPDAPVVTIPLANASGIINAASLNGATTVAAKITLDSTDQTDLTNGGTVQITVNDNGATQSLNLHLNSSGNLVDGSGNAYTYSGGVITLSEAAPGNGHVLTVSSTVTDVNSNLSGIGSAHATQETALPDAPVVTIPLANASGIINAASLNGATSVAAKITLDSTDQTDLTNGGTVQITINDNGAVQSLNLHLNGTSLVDASGNTYGYSGGVITLNETAPGNGNTITVTSTVTDVYSNVSASGSAHATQETALPDAPVVTIPLANASGIINAASLNGATTVAAKITLDTTDQTDLTNGGTVQVTINDNGTAQSLNLHLNGTSLVDASGNTYGYSGGVITLNEAAPGNGNAITVTSTVTDVYSNVSASGSAHATQETALPDTPVVTIPLANASGIINATSLNGAATIAAKITLDSTDQTDLTNGGSVQITINDNGATQSLNLHMSGANLVDGSGNIYAYSGGVITLNETAPGNGNTLTVSSTVTDVYSNVSGSGSAHATQETTPPDTPVVTIPLANASGIINAASLNGATSVAAKITLDSTDQTDLTNGGSVQITVNDNGATQSLNLHLNSSGNLVDGSGNAYTYSGGVITLSEAAPGNGHVLTVSSTVTDVNSNLSGIGSAHATQETALPDAPVVTIPLANASGIINAASLNGATTVAAKITLGTTDQTDLTNGGTVQVTINDNGTTQSLNLHLNGASLVDASGNTYGYSGGVITLNEAAPGNGNAITVTSTVTDVYSNVSASGSAHATQETALPDTPVVTIPLANASGIINATSLNGAATIAAKITLDSTDQTDLTNGGSVQITINDNGATQSLNLHMSGANLVDGSGNIYAYSGGVITLNETAPGNGNTLTVSSTVTDVYSNVSGSGSAHATQETTPPDTPTVAITTDTNHDGVISSAELNGSATVHAAITLDAVGQTDLTNGGTVQVAVVDNGATQNLTLHLSGTSLVDGSGNTYAYSGGVITLNEAAPGNGNSISVTTTETDVYGNLSASANAQATENITIPPAPTTSITTDTNQDGYISAAELNGSTTVTATVTLATAAQTDLSNGGSVQVTVVDDGATQNLSLHLNSSNALVDASGNTYGYSGGVITLTEAAPGNGNSISIGATVTDLYGNVSPASNVSVAQQDVIDAPAVSIAYPSPASTNLTLDTWVSNTTINNQLYTTAGNNGDGTNPGTLINTLSATTIAPTASTTTTVANASVAAGTATEVTGLMYLQAGHTYTFSGSEDDSFALIVGGKLVGSTTWGQSSGALSGTFTASASGWYTLAAYHDNQSGPGDFNVNVSDNGATAVALNSTNFDLAASTTALISSGVALNTEIVTNSSLSFTTTAANSSGAGTVKSSVSGGYYTEKPIADVTLDSNDQSLLTSGGTMNVATSDGTNVTLHWNGSALVDGSGNSYSYSGGVLALPITANPTTPVVSASATVYDSHGVPSLTTTATEIFSGTNSITEVVGGDTFKFELAANGTAGTPNVETLSAFNSNVAGNGADVLNLADLLQGATSSNIGNYLHFTSTTSGSVTTTVVHVSETGAFSSGYTAGHDTLQIALTNVNLLMSGGATQTDAQIIQSLLNKGKLVE